MRSNNWNNLILLEEVLSKFIAKEVRTASDFIVLDYLLKGAGFIIDWVSPDQIAE